MYVLEMLNDFKISLNVILLKAWSHWRSNAKTNITNLDFEFGLRYRTVGKKAHNKPASAIE